MSKIHSEEYIGDHRYLWWNRDYLHLLLERINFDQVSTILDLGVGAGHWAACLMHESCHPLEICGVDYEPHWVNIAQKNLSRIGVGHKVSTILSDAHKLPLPDNMFDLSTCQTLLMHSKEPQKIVDEMTRVTKTGGTVFVVEPTNILGRIQFFDSLLHLNAEDRIILYKAWSYYHDGQKKMEGFDHDIAPFVPNLFKKSGLKNIRVYQNDCVTIEKQVEENFISMQKEYESPLFKEYALAGGADPMDMENAFLVFRKLMLAVRKENLMRSYPIGSFIFIGTK